MDDVALVHEDTNGLQEVMNTTNHIALNKHIELEAAQCKLVKTDGENDKLNHPK